jgi:multiple sugar transport system permease protein
MPLPTLGARFGEASLWRGQAPCATRLHRGELSERALGVAMLAPMVLVLLLVVAYPLADALWLSLHRVNLANPEQGQPFVGLGNYLHAFRQPVFWYSIHRTLYFTLVSVALELALGLLFAVLLNERFRGNLGARLAMIFPWALLTVSNGVLWAWILNPTYGVANALLVGLGVLQAPKAWLSDTFWTMQVVILADVWKMVPTMTLLLLAGLQPISPDLYEAAEVDGATRWQKFSRITLPLLRPVLLVAVVLRTIGAFRVFDLIYVLTGNGGPADSTKVIAFYAYDQAFHYLFFGYGAAISWIITACMLVLIVIYMHWLRTEGER